jgi:uncharacterized protein (DUF952 family)
MRTIYHLVRKDAWAANPDQPYRADSLASEGFIHCSFADQVAWAANRFYPDQPDLLVLHIDPARLISPLREEESGTAGVFPHVYGPINRDAVVTVLALGRGVDGRWEFSGS